MNGSDLQYLCGIIGGLCGIPTRLYKTAKLVFVHSTADLPADPITLHSDEIFKIKEHVGYFVTPDFFYYGVINYKDYKLVIGPARQVYDDRTLTDLAFRLDVSPEQTKKFISSMKSVICMPLESILQVMIAMNFVLNKERLGLEDVVIYDEDQERMRKAMAREQLDKTIKQFDASEETVQHNTLATEQTIMNMVRKGDVQALDEWAKNAPSSRAGVMAPDQLRQVKNTLIVSATLASRAAIRGGVDIEEALTLSDSYIQKCELTGNITQLTNLQFLMIRDFTERVSRVRFGGKSTLAKEAANYIRRHISEPVTAEDIAAHLYMSRPYLSKKFKEETGESISDFIQKEKLQEGCHLLAHTKKPLAAIASYLGFSSQSHFTHAFKKYLSLTPLEYRRKHAFD